ncbi:uncharacterized protein LOC119672648 [Teleopsis dalmanni]|uniref:uncharacterized protein LOC119670130 n=1 Tax=Teleopsis dalmanni TaxID=139649 RepID=UPI0018CCEEFB|nr:uncharacterized protein LOC119670130 [Teleopsis dalmanni]XP_037939684.1 uncharacterized protein LOC119672648 [Teleopsis dalmanni]
MSITATIDNKMSCSMCKTYSISPGGKPSGQFICKSGHSICNDCIRKNNGICLLCGDKNLRFVSTNLKLQNNGRPVTNSAPRVSTFNPMISLEGDICASNSLKATKPNTVSAPEVEKNIAQVSLETNLINSSYNTVQPTIVKDNNDTKQNINNVVITHGNQQLTSVANKSTDYIEESSSSLLDSLQRHLTYILDTANNNTKNILEETVVGTNSVRSQNVNLPKIITNGAEYVAPHETSTAPTAPPMEPYFNNSLDGQTQFFLPVMNQILLMQLFNTLNASMTVPQTASGFVPMTQNQAMNFAYLRNENVIDPTNPYLVTMRVNDISRMMYEESYNILLKRNQSLTLQNAILKIKLEEKNKKEQTKKHKNDPTNKARKAKDTEDLNKSKQSHCKKCDQLPTQNIENIGNYEECNLDLQEASEGKNSNLRLLFMGHKLNDESDVSSKNVPFHLRHNQETGSTQTFFGIPDQTNKNEEAKISSENEEKSSRKRAGHCNCYRTTCTNMKYKEKVCTISVSTESYPSLSEESKVVISENSIVLLREVTQRQECILTETNKPTNKMVDESMNERMEKILKTINEDTVRGTTIANTYMKNEILLSEKPIYQTAKKSVENAKEIETFPHKEKKKELYEKYEDLLDELSKPDTLLKTDSFIQQSCCNPEDIAELISLALRSRYDPVEGPPITIKGNKLIGNTLIPPQLEIIKYPSKSPAVLARLAKQRFMPKNLTCYDLRIPRHPLLCPECKHYFKCFLSDFIIHMVTAHHELPFDRISPRMVKNFFIDVRVALSAKPKCQMIYLVRDKIAGIGHSEYSDLLPLLIMTGGLRLSEIMHLDNLDANRDINFLVVWGCGLMPGKYPLNIILSTWRNTGRYPSTHIVYSGPASSIREEKTALQVFESGECLYFSPIQQHDLLNNKFMINCQFSIY